MNDATLIDTAFFVLFGAVLSLAILTERESRFRSYGTVLVAREAELGPQMDSPLRHPVALVQRFLREHPVVSFVLGLAVAFGINELSDRV